MNTEVLKSSLVGLLPIFEQEEANLTNLDREIGDGDHGVNMLRGFKAVSEKLSGDTVSDVLKSCGMTLMSAVGGASGPLYGFSFVKMAQVDHDEITKENIQDYFKAFKEAIETRGKVTKNEKTMYDVVSNVYDDLVSGRIPSKEEVTQYALNTKDIMATKGRAAYFKEKSVGVVDPGAMSASYIINALLEGVRL